MLPVSLLSLKVVTVIGERCPQLRERVSSGLSWVSADWCPLRPCLAAAFLSFPQVRDLWSVSYSAVIQRLLSVDWHLLCCCCLYMFLRPWKDSWWGHPGHSMQVSIGFWGLQSNNQDLWYIETRGCKVFLCSWLRVSSTFPTPVLPPWSGAL